MVLKKFLEEATSSVRIELTKVQGSSPRGEGTVMFVSQEDSFGTIGGGQLEYRAIKQARTMLAQAQKQAQMEVPLGPEIGQCCGGFVEINFTLMDASAKAKALADEARSVACEPMVYIFGSGHVGRALAEILMLLPVRPILVDERVAELERCDAKIIKRATPLPEAEVRNAPAGSAFVIVTHDHALDFQITAEALTHPAAPYVGMIGSQTKRRSFEHWCQRNITSSLDFSRLICPIGAKKRKDKRPQVIAVFAAAEIIDSVSAAADLQELGGKVS